MPNPPCLSSWTNRKRDNKRHTVSTFPLNLVSYNRNLSTQTSISCILGLTSGTDCQANAFVIRGNDSAFLSTQNFRVVVLASLKCTERKGTNEGYVPRRVCAFHHELPEHNKKMLKIDMERPLWKQKRNLWQWAISDSKRRYIHHESLKMIHVIIQNGKRYMLQCGTYRIRWLLKASRKEEGKSLYWAEKEKIFQWPGRYNQITLHKGTDDAPYWYLISTSQIREWHSGMGMHRGNQIERKLNH